MNQRAAMADRTRTREPEYEARAGGYGLAAKTLTGQAGVWRPLLPPLNGGVMGVGLAASALSVPRASTDTGWPESAP